MADEPKDDDKGLTVIGPGGWKATVQGQSTIIVLLVGCLVGLGYLHHQSQDQRASEAVAQHQKIDDKFNEIIYVLSLSQPDREKLNISMPESLRGKTRRRNHAED